ncbi:lysyl oxidase family protein [Actinomycetes bacterium KLBMP 9797]
MRNVRALAVATATVSTVLALSSTAAPAGPRWPGLELVATAPAVTVERPFGRARVSLDLGAAMLAGRSPFEIRVSRRSYHDPVVAAQVVRDHGGVRTRPLGGDIVRDFGGFLDFFHVTLTDAAGATVLDAVQDFCPNGESTRLAPGGRPASPYPHACSTNPFALGSVWGVQAGWGTATTGPLQQVDTSAVPDGVYTARLEVTERYRRAFGIPAGAITVEVTLKTVPPKPPVIEQPPPFAEARPTGPVTVPRHGRPDLVALPAWAVAVEGDSFGTPEVETERLTFAANVWNAGSAPLVIAGFRRTGEAVLDSFQYFYDAAGNRTGYAPVGAMEWDSKDGHKHWHFQDFAAYRLLDSDFREVVRGPKEAFCVANTDAIDLLVRDAEWQPENTDLHTSCGKEDTQAIRQVLSSGHGDTYANSAPGRAIDIANVPNGTYYIEVAANPQHRIHETDVDNNVSLRKVILSGTAGERTVLVPPYEMIDTDPS